MSVETGVLSVRISPEVQQRLDALAAVTERSPSWLVNKAIEEFLANQAWQIEEIAHAVAEAEEGDFASNEEIELLNNKYKHHAG